MLTDFDRPATPRPRPPAKARRALSTTTAPALFLTTSSPTTLTDPQADGFLASPARITPHFSLHSGPQSAIDPLQPTDWANEQSKEELRQLLHKAESTIKERETGGLSVEYMLKVYVLMFYSSVRARVDFDSG
jgi:hypothetical protein